MAEAFGPYRVGELLGRGGMGEVHRAYDTVHDRVVALKRLSATHNDDEDFRARFRRESRIAARLREPHVIPIHAYGEIDGRLYLDMRLVEGRDLAAVIADGPLDPARAVRLIAQVAGALDAAHADGLVHRDVKPSNILVTPDDFVYLVDFGIARSVLPAGTHLTASGAVIGTLDYLAPERFGDGLVDGRADV
jgi:serine/threonine kinase PknH